MSIHILIKTETYESDIIISCHSSLDGATHAMLHLNATEDDSDVTYVISSYTVEEK